MSAVFEDRGAARLQARIDSLASFNRHVAHDLRGPLVIRVADGIDGVSKNDSGCNKVFPYAGRPHNGRNHSHP